jgi:hypothetical protein
VIATLAFPFELSLFQNIGIYNFSPVAIIVSTSEAIALFAMVTVLSYVALLSLIALSFYLPQVHAATPIIGLDGFTGFEGGFGICNPVGCILTESGCDVRGECLAHNASALLTTTRANDVIVVVAQCGKDEGQDCFAGITSIADSAGLMWTLRWTYGTISEFYALARTPLSSDRISVTWTGLVTTLVGFVALGVSGANSQSPWAQRVPIQSTDIYSTDGTFTFRAVGAEDFVIVSTAINDAPPCFDGYILPFQNVGGMQIVYPEVDYFIKGEGGSTSVSFTCPTYGGFYVVRIVGDALRGP